MNKYTQCVLVKKKDENSTIEQVSFIPTQYAVKGIYLRLKGLDGNFTDGWEVKSLGITLPEDQLTIYRDVYRHTREASDA